MGVAGSVAETHSQGVRTSPDSNPLHASNAPSILSGGGLPRAFSSAGNRSRRILCFDVAVAASVDSSSPHFKFRLICRRNVHQTALLPRLPETTPEDRLQNVGHKML